MKTLNHSNYILRRSFSDRVDDSFIPDLIFLQNDSFESFICLDNNDEERKKSSKVQEVFGSFFPITDSSKNLILEFLKYRVGDIKYNVKECIDSGKTYSVPLYATLRLLVLDKTEEEGAKKEIKAIKEQEVFFCDIPLMTKTGSFVINGIERVVVSQMRRAPGVFFDSEDSKMFAGKNYMAKIIPVTGSWLDFEFDGRDLLYFRIDKKRKMPVSYLFKVLNMSISDVLSYFYKDYKLIFDNKNWTIEFDYDNSLGKSFDYDLIDAMTNENVVPQGRRITKRLVTQLKEKNFERYVINSEENIFFVLLNDIIDHDTGEILYNAGSELNFEKLENFQKIGINNIDVVIPDSSDYGHYIYNSLLIEKDKEVQSIFLDIYRTVKVSEDAASADVAEKFVNNLFFSNKYNLSDVGRMKMNYRLNINIESEIMHLTKEDILATIKILNKLKHNDEKTDDIDNLANRRLRCTGELMEVQFRAGMAKVERSILEKMNTLEPETIVPQNLINTKPLSTTMADFFATSQLSQFMDQTNPLSELGHKRRITALGPGGLTRERAGFDVRDVHYTHYGKICPIESPEGSNIGLINSLSIFARVNRYGFIETPYRKVKNGVLTDEVVYLSAIEEAGKVFSPFNVKLDDKGKILNESVVCRKDSEIVNITPEAIDYIDVSPRQIISIATSLVPFLENNESRRVSMGANMLKQAVPLLKSEAPYVGTGIERVVATFSNCGIVVSEVEGIVRYIDASKIVIEELKTENEISKIHTYVLDKYLRTNNDTLVNQYPVVKVGQKVKQDEIIADNQSIENGELALGKNVLIAFSTWDGYNYEDSILISERLVRDDAFTSIHLEEFEIEAKDTRLGPEEITRDIPNVGDDVLKKLDETGIIYIGAHVKAGDILVGKTTPKTESPQTPEEKLLKVIFGEKAMDVKDSSLYVPPSVVAGTVIDVKVYTRNGLDKDERAKFIDNVKIEELSHNKDREISLLRKSLLDKIKSLILNKPLEKGIEKIKKGSIITDDLLDEIPNNLLSKISVEDQKANSIIESLGKEFRDSITKIEKLFSETALKIKECDELPQGTLKKVKVIIATKQRLQAGDKMAGRYGNKGVISKILPVEDMPCMDDGTPIDIILSPLSVPSRMNVGQLLETHLGFVSSELGKQISYLLENFNKDRVKNIREKLLRIYKMPREVKYIQELNDDDLLEFAEKLRRNVPFATGSFENISMEKMEELMEEAGIDKSGQVKLMDGRTGEYFDRPLTIGYMYMLKLHHLVDNKIHARSTGPYSLITQQPLGGKSHFGGQRFGEMECWALQAYGAAYSLQEMLTVKSDDIVGRLKIYESIVQGSQSFSCGVPESFNVMVKEVRSLGLNLELVRK